MNRAYFWHLVLLKTSAIHFTSLLNVPANVVYTYRSNRHAQSDAQLIRQISRLLLFQASFELFSLKRHKQVNFGLKQYCVLKYKKTVLVRFNCRFKRVRSEMRNIVQKSLTYFNTKKFKDKVFKDLHKNRVVFIKQE